MLQWAEADGRVLVERHDNRFLITVQDDGVGIPATMRTVNPEFSNEQAVDAALRVGVTSSGDPWRGFGLNSAMDLTRRTGFSVHLASRDVSVWITDGRSTFCHRSGGTIEGTLVQITWMTS